MWVPPEVRDPVLYHAWAHKSVGHWGAIRLRDGKMTYRREVGMLNKETCAEFFRQVHRESTRGRREVVVISGNAGYNYSRLRKDGRAEVAGRFELSFLPAASPQLNPIERAWKLPRRLFLHERYFSKLEDVLRTIEPIFESWGRGNQTLRRLCAIT